MRIRFSPLPGPTESPRRFPRALLTSACRTIAEAEGPSRRALWPWRPLRSRRNLDSEHGLHVTDPPSEAGPVARWTFQPVPGGLARDAPTIGHWGLLLCRSAFVQDGETLAKGAESTFQLQSGRTNSPAYHFAGVAVEWDPKSAGAGAGGCAARASAHCRACMILAPLDLSATRRTSSDDVSMRSWGRPVTRE